MSNVDAFLPAGLRGAGRACFAAGPAHFFPHPLFWLGTGACVILSFSGLYATIQAGCIKRGHNKLSERTVVRLVVARAGYSSSLFFFFFSLFFGGISLCHLQCHDAVPVLDYLPSIDNGGVHLPRRDKITYLGTVPRYPPTCLPRYCIVSSQPSPTRSKVENRSSGTRRYPTKDEATPYIPVHLRLSSEMAFLTGRASCPFAKLTWTGTGIGTGTGAVP